MEAKKSTFSLANLEIDIPPILAPKNARFPSTMPSNPFVSQLPSDTTTDSNHQERVKVFVRIRPTNSHEAPGALRILDRYNVNLSREGHAPQTFTFDAVLPPDSSQAEVYDVAAKQAVADVLEGYNGTIMAYGQTGAGKTYTLSSFEADSVGIMPRAFSDIFQFIESDLTHSYKVTISYLQIYCEQIQDLLRPDAGDSLPIREGRPGDRVINVPDLLQVEVTCLEDCLQLLQIGARNRSVAFTALNAHSSRSHAMVITTVMKRPLAPTIADKTKATKVRVGRLYMVDLAGSERLKKSKSTGQRANEAKAINLSLTTLGMCVSARASGKQTHVPFRDSKLTRLLAESLGGNARTSLVIAACDALEYAEESMQSLLFGSRAMRVVTRATINEQQENNEMSMCIGSPLTSRTSTLVQSLLEKETELEAAQARLRAHEEQSKQVVDALKKEHAFMVQKAADLAARHEAQQAEQEMLLKAVQDAQRWMAESRETWMAEKQALEKEIESLKADVLRSTKEADASHTLLESERHVMARHIEEERASFDQRFAQLEASRKEDIAKSVEELERAKKRWKVEKRELQQQHSMELAASIAQEVAARQRVEQELDALKTEYATFRDDSKSEIKSKELDMLQRYESALKTLHKERNDLKQQMESKSVMIRDLETTCSELRDQLAEQKDQNKSLIKHLDEARVEVRMQEARAIKAENARSKLIHALNKDRKRNEAATVIQRAYRAYRIKCMQLERSEGYVALSQANHALGCLARQHAELEARRHHNLALTGQTLVAESLETLQDLVETLVAEFLLPAKDLRAVQRLRGKIGQGPVTAAVSNDLIGAVRFHQEAKVFNENNFSDHDNVSHRSTSSKAPSLPANYSGFV